MIIYLITNLVNGKQYVGMTRQRLKVRWRGHIHESLRSKRRPICCAIQKYGRENFTIEQIDAATNVEDLKQLEMDWIDTLGTRRNGYNATAGGDGLLDPIPEIRAKMSAARKGVPKSAEHRAKIAAANRGQKRSPEARANVGAASRGRKHSAETKEKQRQAMLGRPTSAETRAKLSAALKGHGMTEASRAKMSESIRNLHQNPEYRAKFLAAQERGHSEETRQKISAKAKQRYADPVFRARACEIAQAREDRRRAVRGQHA